jgi:hypothetical protein
MSGKRCDTDTTGAERNGALGGDGDGLPTDEGQTDERIRKASRGAGEDSSGAQLAVRQRRATVSNRQVLAKRSSGSVRA